tara:strand:+ start:912 stop:1349 length:438 start_codon:yes stop_codon:yes gene_type:complete
MNYIISIDPGKKKCGLLLANLTSINVIEAGISSINSFSRVISFWNEKYNINQIIIGNGTNSKYLENKLNFKNFNNLKLVDEKGSTLRARFRYWEIWPPNYFFRCFPKELLFPPKNLDAVVALILLEDYLNKKLIWPENVNLKTWP